jgi:hypothetical protein
MPNPKAILPRMGEWDVAVGQTTVGPHCRQQASEPGQDKATDDEEHNQRDDGPTDIRRSTG